MVQTYTRTQAIEIAHQMVVNSSQLDDFQGPRATIGTGLNAPVVGYGGDREALWKAEVLPVITAKLQGDGPFAAEDLANIVNKEHQKNGGKGNAG